MAFPSPHEPFTGDKGVITRTWYRVLQSLQTMSGQLAQPILVKPNSFFVSGDIGSGGTLEPQTIPAGNILGNSANVAAAAGPIGIDSSLSLADGSLGMAPIPAMSLMGNAGAASAQAGPVAVGAGLALLPGNPPQLVADGGSGGGSGDLQNAQLFSWWRSG